LIGKSQSNAHIESSNRLEIPRGFSPELFNIEIKKNVVQDRSAGVSPIKFKSLLKPEKPERFKIKAMKAPKNYDPFTEIIKR
jgi:hypothetical protein